MPDAARAPSWIDSHCHISADDYAADRAAVLDAASAGGVTTLIAIGAGYGLAHNAHAVALAQNDARVFATVGVHPHDAAHYDDDAEQQLRAWLAQERVVGVGECGLDYWYERAPRETQRNAFARQVALARELARPVSIHVRDRASDAYHELLDIWQSEGGGETRGVLHCYTHDEAFARRALDAQLEISFSGI